MFTEYQVKVLTGLGFKKVNDHAFTKFSLVNLRNEYHISYKDGFYTLCYYGGVPETYSHITSGFFDVIIHKYQIISDNYINQY